jgi:lysophospholipase
LPQIVISSESLQVKLADMSGIIPVCESEMAMKNVKITLGILIAFMLPVLSLAVSEVNLDQTMSSEVMPYITKHGRYESLIGSRNMAVSTFTLDGTGTKGDVFLVPGQGEFIPKYYEIAYDFIVRGYSAVHIIDHRGQGSSPRVLINEPQKGSVDKFSDYVQDLGLFVSAVRAKRPTQKFYLVAHSMGGAITSILLNQTRKVKTFEAVAFSAPMLGVRAPIAKDSRYLKPVLLALCLVPKSCNDFALGKSKFNLYLDFKGNVLTHSEPRWEMHQTMLQEDSSLGISGPTNRWVLEATRATEQISRIAPPAKLPMLLFQAGNDEVVLPNAQNKYCAKSKNCQLIKVPGANHEILQERDSIRENVVDRIDTFFST